MQHFTDHLKRVYGEWEQMGFITLSVGAFLAIVAVVFGLGAGSGAAAAVLINEKGITLCYT